MRTKRLTAKRLTAQRIMRNTTNSPFLAEMRATGLRGKALKQHSEQERQKQAQIRLQNIRNRAISMGYYTNVPT